MICRVTVVCNLNRYVFFNEFSSYVGQNGTTTFCPTLSVLCANIQKLSRTRAFLSFIDNPWKTCAISTLKYRPLLFNSNSIFQYEFQDYNHANHAWQKTRARASRQKGTRASRDVQSLVAIPMLSIPGFWILTHLLVPTTIQPFSFTDSYTFLVEGQNVANLLSQPVRNLLSHLVIDGSVFCPGTTLRKIATVERRKTGQKRWNRMSHIQQNLVSTFSTKRKY